MREREQREKAGERAERERAERESREREQREQILSSSSFGSTFKRFAPAPLESHQPPPSTPPGSASNTMADEREIVSVDSSEEEDSDDAWGHWTAKGRRVLPTQELLAATASSRRVASKRAASAKPSDDLVPGSARDPPAARHRRTAMHGSWQSLDAKLCLLQAEVDKINHAKGKPGSASCELFVGMSAMKRPACSMLADKVGRPEKASRPQKASRSSCNDEDGSNGSKALASIGKVARGEGDRGDTQNSMNHLKALFAQGHTEPLETYKDLVWDDGTRMDHIICPGCNEDCWPPLAPWGRCSRCEQYASPTKAEYWNRDVKKLKRIVSEPLEPSEVS